MTIYDEFVKWMESRRGVSAVTLAGYVSKVKTFYADSGEGQVTHQAIRKHIRGLAGAGRSAHAATTALKMWCLFLVRSGKQTDAPYNLIEHPKAQGKRAVVDLTSAIEAHLEPQANTDSYILGRACMMLLYSAMLRPSEIAAMTWAHVDFWNSLVVVNDKERPIHGVALNALSDWYNRISGVARGPHVPVVTRSGAYSGVEAIAVALRAVDKRLTPSGVRDTAIRSMLKAGATLESVSRCAGISFAAASRRSGYTTSFRNVQACYMHNHPHAEVADEAHD